MSTPDPALEKLFQQMDGPGITQAERIDLEAQAFARYKDLVRGGTAGNGLPYPSPTDPISEGADAIRALAAAVSPQLLATPFWRVKPTAQEVLSGADKLLIGFTQTVVTAGKTWAEWEIQLTNANSGITITSYASVFVDGVKNADSERTVGIGNNGSGILAGTVLVNPAAGSHRFEIWGRGSTSGGMVVGSGSLRVSAVN